MCVDNKRTIYKCVRERWEFVIRCLLTVFISYLKRKQVDKKRKILSDISNTHDKHIKRSDNHRYWWCSPLSSQSQWELCQRRDGCSYPDDRGLWSHLKDFLPSRGMKSRDLGSSLGWFMWTQFCSQRKLDVFVHFLKSAAEVRPPSHFSRLPTADMKTLIKAITVNSDEA